MSASGAGGIGFKSRANQISHDLPPLQPLKCVHWLKAAEIGHRSLLTLERVLS